MTPEEFIIMVQKLLKRLDNPTTPVKQVNVYTHTEAYHIVKEGFEKYHDGE